MQQPIKAELHFINLSIFEQQRQQWEECFRYVIDFLF
jgi:hypothetical protein